MKHSAHKVKLHVWWKSSQIFGRVSLPLTPGDGNYMSIWGELRRPSESTKGGLEWTGTPAWTSKLSSSNWCHMIQKDHMTPTATSCHALTKAECYCWKFGNFFHHNLTLCAKCFIRNYVSRFQKHSLFNHNNWRKTCSTGSQVTLFFHWG